MIPNIISVRNAKAYSIPSPKIDASTLAKNAYKPTRLTIKNATKLKICPRIVNILETGVSKTIVYDNKKLEIPNNIELHINLLVSSSLSQLSFFWILEI